MGVAAVTSVTDLFGRRVVIALGLLLGAHAGALAQETPRVFVGSIVGVSTLSADVRSVSNGNEAHIGMYKPENGLAINTFAGIHLWEYFSLQGNYMWNRNDLTLISSLVRPQAGGFYESTHVSAQHAFVIDGLLYFRRRDSALRPYLGTGMCVVHFNSRTVAASATGLVNVAAGQIASTQIALRSAVGIDLWMNRYVALRYSFSETISANPISPHLMPMGERGLANFQNLFGFVARF